MGRPYQEKFTDVKWEVNEEHFNAWKEGKTGVPIVDAGMRQMNTMGKAVNFDQFHGMLNSDVLGFRLDAQPRKDDHCHVLDEGSHVGLAVGREGL